MSRQQAKHIGSRIYEVHSFGVKYNRHQHRQSYFEQVILKEAVDNQVTMCFEQNQQLKQEIRMVKYILGDLLYLHNPESQSKPLIDFIEELLELIMAKSDENAELKRQVNDFEKRIEEIQRKLFDYQHYTLNQKISHCQFSKQRQSGFNIFYYQKGHYNHPKDIKTSDNVILDTRPNVFSLLGKEVNTINQISTNQLIKKEQFNKLSNESVLVGKKKRLSIDKNIYSRHIISNSQQHFLLIPECKINYSQHLIEDTKRRQINDTGSVQKKSYIHQQHQNQTYISRIVHLQKLPKRSSLELNNMQKYNS